MLFRLFPVAFLPIIYWLLMEVNRKMVTLAADAVVIVRAAMWTLCAWSGRRSCDPTATR